MFGAGESNGGMHYRTAPHTHTLGQATIDCHTLNKKKKKDPFLGGGGGCNYCSTWVTKNPNQTKMSKVQIQAQIGSCL